MTSKDQQKLKFLLDNTGDMALKRRAKKIIEEIDPTDGDKILEVGCGDGYYLHILHELNHKLKLTGTDYDLAGLKSARNHLTGTKIKLVWGDLMKKMPFKSNSFDKIIMSEVAEHLPNDVKGLKEVRRILKPGGTLCITVPNHNYPIFWDPVNWVLEHLFETHIHKGFWAGLWNQHIRLYKPDQLGVVVKKSGFNIQEKKALTFWSLPFNHNLVHFGARMLHSGKMNPAAADSINKFKHPKNRKLLPTIYFSIVNLVDKLNDLGTPNPNWGVGVFIKASK